MTESKQAFRSVWDALEDTPAEAENMRIRSSLMMAIRGVIEARKLSQAESAQLFNVTQPRISDLQCGKIDLFSVDSLINMLAQGGMNVEVSVKTAAGESWDSWFEDSSVTADFMAEGEQSADQKRDAF